ncbi:aldehyde dehydrogenase family protein [Beggiatoa alba]|nr:aldehyde dehydrogenase family protein [Beggiatoa alba]
MNIQSINQGGCCAKDNWYHAKQSIESINPYDQTHIASVLCCDNANYHNIRINSQQAFLKWRHVPAPQRGECIRRIADELRQYKDALGSLVTMETGKIKTEGDGEVQEMIDMADFAVGLSRMLYGKTMHSERVQHRMYEQWHPLGVVGVISAFNFPVAVWAWNAFIAAVCGNTVIWKPSSRTPLCAIAVQHICNRVMHDMGCEGVFSLFIPENRKVAQLLVDDSSIPLISFTGSSTTGKKIASSVSARLGRYLLEMSGNNAIIVDPSADLDLAVPAIVFGAVGTAGQRCTSTRRLLVDKTIKEPLLKRLLDAYAQIKIGDPLNSETLMGPLIDKQAVSQFEKTISEIQKQGGEVLYGGHTLQQPGNFVAPTLVCANSDLEAVQKETFAPILYVIEYETLDQAIALQNAVPQGLSSALFSNQIRHCEQFLSAMGSDCGIANINIGTSGAEIGGAFGGEKETGGGREAGSDSWKAYMRRQTCTINWSQAMPLAQGIEFNLGKRNE